MFRTLVNSVFGTSAPEPTDKMPDLKATTSVISPIKDENKEENDYVDLKQEQEEKAKKKAEKLAQEQAEKERFIKAELAVKKLTEILIESQRKLEQLESEKKVLADYLNAQISDKEVSATELLNQLKKQKEEIANLKDENDHLKKSVESLQEEDVNHLDAIYMLEAELDGSNREKVDVKERVAELTQELKNLRELRRQDQEKLINLDQSLVETRKDLQDLHVLRRQDQKRMFDDQVKIAGDQERILELETDLKALRVLRRKDQENLDNFDMSLIETQDAKQNLENDLYDVQSDLHATVADLRRLRVEDQHKLIEQDVLLQELADYTMALAESFQQLSLKLELSNKAISMKDRYNSTQESNFKKQITHLEAELISAKIKPIEDKSTMTEDLTEAFENLFDDRKSLKEEKDEKRVSFKHSSNDVDMLDPHDKLVSKLTDLKSKRMSGNIEKEFAHTQKALARDKRFRGDASFGRSSHGMFRPARYQPERALDAPVKTNSFKKR